MHIHKHRDAEAPSDTWVPALQSCTACQGEGMIPDEHRTLHICAACSGQKMVQASIPPVSHVSIRNAPAVKHLSQHLVMEGMREGWIAVSGGTLSMATRPAPLVWVIMRTPGTYCCYCGDAIAGDASGSTAHDHVAQQHGGLPSPDPGRPAGYVRANGWMLRRRENG